MERALEDGLDTTVERLVHGDEGHEGHEASPELLRGIEPLLGADNLELLQAWWMALILDGGGRLAERCALMWHDHFATSHDKVGDVRLMHRQNQIFRRLGLGDFRELLHAVATDPAMLLWLDGDRNRRGQPNENFAREVFELFGLGIGHYTERDVQEAARAFTGWGTHGRAFRLRPGDHDAGEKVVLGKSGTFGGEQVIDLILEHPACSRHIAHRLLQEFVMPSPTPDAVHLIARHLLWNDFRIDRLVAGVLRSELFFSAAARRSRIAGPVELLAVTARALGAKVSPLEAARAATRMGQALFRPPSVKGWDGGRAWINAGTWLARHNSLSALGAAHGARDGASGVQVDLRKSAGDPGSREEAGSRLLSVLMPDVQGIGFEARLRRACAAAPDIDTALALAVNLIVTAPEYHFV